MIFTWLLSNWRIVLFTLLIAAVGVQTGRITLLKSEYAKEAAERTAQEATERARIESNAKDALDALQNRYAALDARYRVLRGQSNTDLASFAPKPKACPGEPDQSDASSRFLGEVEAEIKGVLEQGDREIAKYVELWKLQQENAVPKPSP